jgi:hypothetical protein
MAPHLGLAGVAAYKGIPLINEVDETQPFYPQMADRAVGLGYLGFGSGLVKRGIEQATNPGTPPDARSLAIINSNRLMRNNLNAPIGNSPINRGQIVDADVIPDRPQQLPPPQAEAPREVQPGSKADYMRQAQSLGVKGRTRMTKAQLVDAVNEANKGNATRRVRGPRVIPGAAGAALGAGMAYMATPSDAQASTGGSVTGQDRALTNAAITGGIAAGTNRLLQAVPKLAPALGVAGAGLSAYDYASQAQDIQEGLPEGVPADLMAQVAPLAMRGMDDAQAWQDLPQNTREFVARNQSDPTMGMANEVQAMPPQEAAQPDFEQSLAELQAIFAEMEQGQQTPRTMQTMRRPPQTPMPAPPPAYGGQQNRLLQPTGY